MRTLAFILTGYAIIVAQTTLFQVLPAWIGAPDLLLLLIVFLAISFDIPRGGLICLLLGIGQDVCAGYFTGLHVIAYLLVFFVVKGLAQALVINEANHQPPVVAASYLGSCAVVYACTSMLADSPIAPWSWGSVLLRLLIVIILVVPANRFFEFLYRFFDPRKRRFFSQDRKGNRYRKVAG